MAGPGAGDLRQPSRRGPWWTERRGRRPGRGLAGSFLRGRHLRDGFVRLGLVSETFETAVTWDRFWEFHEGVLAATRQAVRQACGGGVVSCRFAYVYPDGPAPYYSVFAPGRPGRELEQWDEIKLAASEAIAALGGTITHHHAVGRDHRRWYLREVPPLFADALRGAKRTRPGRDHEPGSLARAGRSRDVRPRRRQMMSGALPEGPVCPDPERRRARCSARN